MLYSLIDLFSGAIVPLIVVLFIFGIVKKVGFKKNILIILFTLYLAEMLDVVGVPYIQVLTWNPIVNWIPFSDLFEEGSSFWMIFQFVANIVLFLPFGAFLPMIWKRFRRFRSTMIAGVLMSIFIEFTQLFCARLTAIDDILMNTLGTIFGYLFIAILSKKRWKKNYTQVRLTHKNDTIELLIVVGTVFISTIFIKYGIGSYIYNLPMFK